MLILQNAEPQYLCNRDRLQRLSVSKYLLMTSPVARMRHVKVIVVPPDVKPHRPVPRLLHHAPVRLPLLLVLPRPAVVLGLGVGQVPRDDPGGGPHYAPQLPH